MLEISKIYILIKLILYNTLGITNLLACLENAIFSSVYNKQLTFKQKNMPLRKIKSMLFGGSDNSIEKMPMDRKIEIEKIPEDELEKIDIITLKLKEKYGEYSDFDLFIDYLSSMERIFIMTKMGSWGADDVKKAFIDAESYLISLDSGIDEEIFESIKGDFESAYKTLDSIRSVANKLIEQYTDSESCVDFIKYMRDTLILLSDISNINIDDDKDKVLRARMLLISNYDGKTDLVKLEEVYNDFKDKIKENIDKSIKNK